MSYSAHDHRKLAIAAVLLASAVVPGQGWAQTIVGTAIDSSATRALNGVEVELVEPGRIEITASDGSFRLSGVPAGIYTLIARYSGALPATQTMVVPAAGEVTASFVIGAPGDDLMLDRLAGSQSYGLALIDPVPGGNELSDFIDTNGYGNFSHNDLESTFVSAAEDFRAKEDVYASYLLGRYITSDLRVIAGVRMERTENTFFANRLDINEDGDLTTGRFIPLPASAKHTFNAVLGYEKGPISLRVAGAYSFSIAAVGNRYEASRLSHKLA